jgi:hypothetical protein
MIYCRKVVAKSLQDDIGVLQKIRMLSLQTTSGSNLPIGHSQIIYIPARFQ